MRSVALESESLTSLHDAAHRQGAALVKWCEQSNLATPTKVLETQGDPVTIMVEMARALTRLNPRMEDYDRFIAFLGDTIEEFTGKMGSGFIGCTLSYQDNAQDIPDTIKDGDMRRFIAFTETGEVVDSGFQGRHRDLTMGAGGYKIDDSALFMEALQNRRHIMFELEAKEGKDEFSAEQTQQIGLLGQIAAAVASQPETLGQLIAQTAEQTLAATPGSSPSGPQLLTDIITTLVDKNILPPAIAEAVISEFSSTAPVTSNAVVVEMATPMAAEASISNVEAPVVADGTIAIEPPSAQAAEAAKIETPVTIVAEGAAAEAPSLPVAQTVDAPLVSAAEAPKVAEPQSAAEAVTIKAQSNDSVAAGIVSAKDVATPIPANDAQIGEVAIAAPSEKISTTVVTVDAPIASVETVSVDTPKATAPAVSSTENTVSDAPQAIANAPAITAQNAEVSVPAQAAQIVSVSAASVETVAEVPVTTVKETAAAVTIASVSETIQTAPIERRVEVSAPIATVSVNVPDVAAVVTTPVNGATETTITTPEKPASPVTQTVANVVEPVTVTPLQTFTSAPVQQVQTPQVEVVTPTTAPSPQTTTITPQTQNAPLEAPTMGANDFTQPQQSAAPHVASETQPIQQPTQNQAAPAQPETNFVQPAPTTGPAPVTPEFTIVTAPVQPQPTQDLTTGNNPPSPNQDPTRDVAPQPKSFIPPATNPADLEKGRPHWEKERTPNLTSRPTGQPKAPIDNRITQPRIIIDSITPRTSVHIAPTSPSSFTSPAATGSVGLLDKTRLTQDSKQTRPTSQFKRVCPKTGGETECKSSCGACPIDRMVAKMKP